jgi:tRNA-Thr(GGU) m(6)t(6)A37 methyltransferase TsaA
MSQRFIVVGVTSIICAAAFFFHRRKLLNSNSGDSSRNHDDTTNQHNIDLNCTEEDVVICKNSISDLIKELAQTKLANEELTSKLLKSEKECDLSAQSLQKERLGRINVQKRERDRLTHENLKSGYQYRPIGFVESPFPDRRGTPRQPVLVPAAKGKIRFDKSLIQNEHFKEINQFSHIWVIFVFHENTNTDSVALPARITPPRLGKKVGCLTTRSPHRPNNLGLSVCEVVEVGNDFIGISGIDFVDGTPVLDIKPYIPYDSIQLQTEENGTHSIPLPMSVEASSCMQSDGSIYEARKLVVPTWIVDSDVPMHPVSFDECALKTIEDLVLDRMLNHCSTTGQAIDLITQVYAEVIDKLNYQ